MVEVKNLNKLFGKRAALSNLSFEVPSGSIVGIVGANGAGKSTLFDILATLDSKFEGEVYISGIDIKRNPRAIRPILGYLPGLFSLYKDLTVEENINFFAKIYGKSTKLLDSIELWDSLQEFSHFKADQLSGGMQQKLSLLSAVIHSPSLLLLDEPTTGIDVESRATIWRELIKLKSRGVTTIVSTHYYEEFAYLDSLMLLHEGKRLFFRTKEEIAAPSNGGDLFYEEYLSQALQNFQGG